MSRTNRQSLVSRAQQIVNLAEGEGRGLTGSERDTINALLDGIALDKQMETFGRQMSTPIGGVGGLYGAMTTAGYDRRSHPSVVVPFSTFGAAASFDGDYSDAIPVRRVAAPLGADSRFLYPEFPVQGVEPDATSVASFRQKTRTLPNPLSDMIRDIDASDAKPETDTQAEVVGESLHQIATVSSGTPNIMLENAAMRGWINDDLSFAYASVVDFHVTDQIGNAGPSTATAGADLLESILNAVEVVAAAGYAPSVLAASPETLIELRLLKQPGTDDYVFSGNQEL